MLMKSLLISYTKHLSWKANIRDTLFEATIIHIFLRHWGLFQMGFLFEWATYQSFTVYIISPYWYNAMEHYAVMEQYNRRVSIIWCHLVFHVRWGLPSFVLVLALRDLFWRPVQQVFAWVNETLSTYTISFFSYL